jgi:hypothetical protein
MSKVGNQKRKEQMKNYEIGTSVTEKTAYFVMVRDVKEIERIRKIGIRATYDGCIRLLTDKDYIVNKGDGVLEEDGSQDFALIEVMPEGITGEIAYDDSEYQGVLKGYGKRLKQNTIEAKYLRFEGLYHCFKFGDSFHAVRIALKQDEAPMASKNSQVSLIW